MSFDDQKEYDHGDIHKMDDYVNEDHDEEADNSAVSRAVLISEPVCSSDEEYDNVRKSCTQDNQEKHWIKVEMIEQNNDKSFRSQWLSELIEELKTKWPNSFNDNTQIGSALRTSIVVRISYPTTTIHHRLYSIDYRV